MEHVMVGHPGFFFFSKRGLSITVLHSFVSCMTSVVGRTLLLPRISLRYLAYVVSDCLSGEKR